MSNGNGFRKNVISPDNKRKEILYLGKGPTDGLYDTKTTAEIIEILLKYYWHQKKKLSLHYNWSNSFLYVNDVNSYIFYFIFKNSEMTTFTSRLDNILKDFANIDRKNSGLNVYQFVIIVLILKIFWIFINIKY